MTELRDARLRKAMEEAPDAQAQPPARVREAIRAAAHGAVQPRWRGWWSTPQRQNMRWVAFASVAVLVAGVVLSERWGLPWLQQEPKLAQAPTPVPAPAREAAPQPQAAPQAGAAPSQEAARSARAPVRADAPQARPKSAAPDTSPAEPPAVVAAAPPPPAAADALAKAAPSEARSPAEGTPPPPAAPAAPAAPPPFAQAPAPRAAAPAAPAAAAALRASPAALPWTQARIESGGRSVVVPRMQAGELAAFVTSMLASPSDDAEPGPPGSLRLELAQGDESAGVLELVGDRWRWTSLRESRRPRMLKPDAGVAAALRGEAERLLRN